jgi:hypothetical protein
MDWKPIAFEEAERRRQEAKWNSEGTVGRSVRAGSKPLSRQDCRIRNRVELEMKLGQVMGIPSRRTRRKVSNRGMRTVTPLKNRSSVEFRSKRSSESMVRRIPALRIAKALGIFIVISVIFIATLMSHGTRPMFLNRSGFDPCACIDHVQSREYTIEISFSDSIPVHLQKTLHSYFGYQSTAFGLPFLILPGRAKPLTVGSAESTIEFPFPFIQNYTGFLLCANPDHFKPSVFGLPHNLLPLVDNYVPLNIRIDDFRDDFSWSQMKCFGNSFETRFCEMRRVSVYQQLFVFSTEADYVFPEPFLSAGGRAAPFDRPEGRLSFEPIVVHSPIEMLSPEVEYIDRLSYIITRFFNSFMLWHTLFDFLVPAFHTFDLIERGNFSPGRLIFLRDYDIDSWFDLLQSMSHRDITYLLADRRTRTFSRVIVGLAKLERNPSAARGDNGMFAIRYNFDRDTAPRLRSSVFWRLNLSVPALDPFAPLILIVERNASSRRWNNLEEIEQYMLERCDFCEIRRADLGQMAIREQIRLVSEATVLVGVHGSGLSHVLWMNERSEAEPTSLIEVLPYAYNCRDWFESAAAVARVRHHRVVSARRIMPENVKDPEQLVACWDRPELCQSYDCHDLLRDQNITLDIGSFSSAWMAVVNDLKTAQKLSGR